MKVFISVMNILFMLLAFGCTTTKQPVEAVYYKNLDEIRKNKHQQLIQYMTTVQEVADSIGKDEVMKKLFNGKNTIYKQYKNTTPPVEIQSSLFQLRDAIEDRYIENYLIFTDILFVNQGGDIFYTVRRRADYHKNIFEGKLAETNLSHQLKNNPKKKFVDFQNYEISGDPAAFFVEPHKNGSETLGWFILQFSINKINDMFSIEEALGQTGEVFLVNKDCYMLTDSRFFADSTILKKHLSEQNIREKFSERSGHKLVTDYRGYRAITSFEVISLLESEWLLIAKIDEDEVLTEEYRQGKDTYTTQLLQLAEQEAQKYKNTKNKLIKGVEVEIDEFRRASDGEILYTHGVSTCTAFIISRKKEFGYLAHISAYDWLYGGEQTDIARRMLDRVDKFDVVENDKREIEILLVSPNLPNTEKLIDALIDWGIFLSQIKVMNNPKARYANLSHDYMKAETIIEWRVTGKPDKNTTVSLKNAKTLGDLFKTAKT